MVTASNPITNGGTAIKYGIHQHESRKLLASHLKQVITRAYKFLAYGSSLREELSYLNESVGLLAKEKTGTLLVRQGEIQQCIDEFFDLMENLRAYADATSSHKELKPSVERKMGKALRKFTAKMNKATNVSLRPFEETILRDIERQDTVKFFYVSLNLISSPFRPIFDGYCSSAESSEKQTRLNLLNQFSPALATAYQETESLLTETRTLKNSSEDEYFIEEVTKDYYVHIFENLQNVSQESADFLRKEAVVTESLKQFQIIQAGLNKIIENSIDNNLNQMKSQTDFLRNKILGSRAFRLSPSEMEKEVQEKIEQGKQLREELYKNHVAPQIEQNRLEYEAQLTAMQAEHQKEMAMMQEKYEEQIKTLEEDSASLRAFYHREKKDAEEKLLNLDSIIRDNERVIRDMNNGDSSLSEFPKRQKEPEATISVSPLLTQRINIGSLKSSSGDIDKG